MALFETVLVSDLKKPIQVKALTGNLFSADNNGNKITVSIMDNGAAAEITGNVTGYVIRADGKTVVVDGELVGNMASIVLPASAYAVIGRVSIVVKVGATTVGACTSNVYRSTTDEIVDPGTVIPSITALMEQIAAAIEEVEDVVDSIPPDYTELVEEVNNKVDMNHATQYTPSNSATFDYGTWYHEIGTSYIARLNDSHAPADPELVSVWQVYGTSPYHIPTSSDADWLVYTFADAMEHINDFQNNIADIFYSGVVYEEGHYVTRNGVTYKRKSWGSTTPVAKAWSASDWEKVEVANDLNEKIGSECSALKSALVINGLDFFEVETITWFRGTIGSGTRDQIGTTGKRYESSTTRIVWEPYVDIRTISTINVSVENGYKYYIYGINESVSVMTEITGWTTEDGTYDISSYRYLIVILAKTDNGTIDIDASANIEITCNAYANIIENYFDDIKSIPEIKDLQGKTTAESTKNIFRFDTTEGYPKKQSSETTIVTTQSQKTACVYAKCKPNTTYTISKAVTARFAVMWSKVEPNAGVTVYGQIRNNTAKSITITTGADAEYIVAWVYAESYDTLTLKQICNTVQIEEGSTATKYDAPFTAVDYTARQEAERLAEIPSYWQTYLDNKLPTLRSADSSLGRNGVSFAFVTDVHVNTNNMVSPKLLRWITKHTNVKEVVFGGDLITDYNTRANALTELYRWTNSTGDLRIVNLHGNHDNNSNNQTDQTQIITDAEFYGLECRQSENFVNFVPGKLYGYQDNENQKVRFIFLDTGAPDSAVIDNTQLAWMQSRISELGSGWTVIVFCHQFWTGANKTTATLNIDSNGTAIMNALDAIYDDVSATIACVIAGHCHRNYSMTSTKGYPIIATTCDAGSTNASTYDPDTPNRTAGTTAEQVVDLFYVNTDSSEKTISIIRIGAGDTDEDRSFTF